MLSCWLCPCILYMVRDCGPMLTLDRPTQTMVEYKCWGEPHWSEPLAGVDNTDPTCPHGVSIFIQPIINPSIVIISSVTCAHPYTHKYTYLYAILYIQTHRYTPNYIRINIHTCIHTYMRIHVHTYIHICIHTSHTTDASTFLVPFPSSSPSSPSSSPSSSSFFFLSYSIVGTTVSWETRGWLNL